MRKEILSSSIWLVAGNGVQQVLQLLTFILLARFLAPATFGYVALAGVVLDTAAVIGMWGLIQIAQQRRGVLSTRLTAHIFVFSLVIAAALSLIIVAGVGAYAFFFGFGLTGKLILMLVPVLFFQGLGIAPEAVLYHRMEFKWFAIRNNMAALLGGGAAVVLALLHLEVYALVVQRLVALAALCVVVWIAAGRHVHLLPLRKYDWRIFRSLAKNGAQIVSAPIAATLSGRTMDGVIGTFLGPASLGAFKITWRIFELVMQFTINPLNAVLSSAFPKLLNTPDELRKIFQEIATVCAILILPAFTGLGITAPQWVPLILGKQWMMTIPLFRIVSANGIAAVMTGLLVSLLLAFRMNAFILKENIAATILIGIAALTGVHFGLGSAIGLYVAASYAVVLFNIVIISRVAGWPLSGFVKIFVPSVLGTAGMTFVLVSLRKIGLPQSNILALAEQVAAGVVSYSFILITVFGRNLVPMLKQIRAGKAVVANAPTSLEKEADGSLLPQPDTSFVSDP